MRETGRIAATVALGFLSINWGAWAEPITPGMGQQTTVIAGTRMTVFTYRPTGCSDPQLLLVFHGGSRNAEGYRDHARGLGDTLCMLVVSPLFDEESFPSWRYQRGGIVRKRKVQDPSTWTGRLALGLIGWVRTEEGRQLAYSMIGHSGGAQFLSRFAAFIPNEARHIVIANPSTYVFPDLQTDAPYGLGGVYAAAAAEAQLRLYLEQPVTIFLGQEDTGTKDRNDSAPARAQGKTRYERGLNAYKAAAKVALDKGWSCNWRLVVLPGVGHSARKMFASKQAVDALLP
jgi:pimeloyl-ACP methyl ester carboxylesterase